jgi:hypothetical protein
MCRVANTEQLATTQLNSVEGAKKKKDTEWVMKK